MKFIIALLTLSMSVAACSKSSKDDKPLSPFQKASGGQWLSECQQNNGAGYRETVILNGTSGTSTSQYFQNTDCTGAVTKTEGPMSFTYTSINKAGGKDGEASVTITLQDGKSVTVEIVIQGNTMVITSQARTVIYQRQGGTPGQKQSPQMAAFDAVAKGNWITRDCRTVNGGSYYQILTIKGAGQASVVYNVYNNNDQCQGNPTPQSPSDITYVVDRYANGGGQLTIDSQTVDVTINGSQMDIISPNGTIVFIRIR